MSRRRRFPIGAVLSWIIVSLGLSLAWTWWQGGDGPRDVTPVVSVWNARAAALLEFPLEHYVHGVVAAEVPASFHPEALKAQAVAARTYALRRIERDARLAELDGAHVSTDFQLHQAWVDEAHFVAARPETGSAQWSRIGEAVAETRGLVLTYGGEPIEALYHSTSGGHTEDADRYFVGGQPYLRAVPDPFGAHSPVHESTAVMSIDAVLRQLHGPAGDDAVARASFAGGYRAAAEAETGGSEGAAVGGFMRVLTRTASGRAARVVVGGRTFTGREVREALGLRSSWFDVTVHGDRVVFDVRGSGHGVGMAQYGADGMARAGYTFEEILSHYYPGAKLERRY